VTRYLLDTNIVSDLVRQQQGEIAARIRRVGERNVATSVVVGR
jgi:tRNA(fMet)-specific endonuclease VapC